jgi:hypothetical protein
MRGYLTMELIGTLWVIAGMFASAEKQVAVAIIFLAIGLSYFFRAIIKYFGSKEKTNAKNSNKLEPGVYAGRTRMRHFESGLPSDRINHVG